MKLSSALIIAAASAIFGAIGFIVGATNAKTVFRSGLDWQLADAAAIGDLNALDSLRRRGADVNAVPVDYFVGDSGIPPIQVASTYGRAKAVAWLIEHGANVNTAMGPDTALSIAEEHLSDAQLTLDVLKANGAKHWNER